MSEHEMRNNILQPVVRDSSSPLTASSSPMLPSESSFTPTPALQISLWSLCLHLQDCSCGGARWKRPTWSLLWTDLSSGWHGGVGSQTGLTWVQWWLFYFHLFKYYSTFKYCLHRPQLLEKQKMYRKQGGDTEVQGSLLKCQIKAGERWESMTEGVIAVVWGAFILWRMQGISMGWAWISPKPFHYPTWSASIWVVKKQIFTDSDASLSIYAEFKV